MGSWQTRWAWEKPSRPSPSSRTSWSTNGSMDPTSLLYPSRELTLIICKNSACLNPPSMAQFLAQTVLSCSKMTELSLIDRTLSNWVYEFDKWAPTVVKVSYKVSFCSCSTQIDCFLHTNTKCVNSFLQIHLLIVLFSHLYHKMLY